MPESGFVSDEKVSGMSGAEVVSVPRDVAATARRWLDEFGTIALATVIKTWGSSPVPVGGQLVIGPEERFEGSVSGGCVEAAVITAAAEVMVATGRRLKIDKPCRVRGQYSCQQQLSIILNEVLTGFILFNNII